MPEDDSIPKLLRLKRYEQPPPGYYQDFLAEFRDRQRAELIRRPLWQLFLDRFFSFAPTFQVPRMAYAAIAMMAVAASVVILNPRTTDQPLVAQSEPLSLSTSSPQAVRIGDSLPLAMTSTGSPSVHYVLPTRPVSYASSRSF